MKILLSWLRDFVDIQDATDVLAHRLTMAGLEVEGVDRYETIQGNLEGVVVGKVLKVRPHPNADRLRCTIVDIGTSVPLNIVCGAPNVAEGQTVLVAIAGSTIYPVTGDPITLKKTKIRGEESEGMICAEDELGLGESHDGIKILPDHWPAGTPAAEVCNLIQDEVIHIGLTANRSDATSHYGVARDYAALDGLPLNMPSQLPLPDRIPPIKVSLQAGSACPRYAGLYIESVGFAESPSWMQDRLKAIGMRPINLVVDVTNYVMLEMGQPLHAFDADKIAGQHIIVRNAAPGEKMTLLDGSTPELQSGDLLICDEQHPLALAGIMGGIDSSITPETRNLYVESAWFAPETIRTTGRRLGIRTDSSFRFERGADPEMVIPALARVAWLLRELAQVSPSAFMVVESNDTSLIAPRKIVFRPERAAQMMGGIPESDIRRILQNLDIEVIEDGHAGIWNLTVPVYRYDVLREQDVMEEILRIYGQNNIRIPSRMTLAPESGNEAWWFRQRLADHLAGSGWREILTNSLVPKHFTNEDSVTLLNSLSEDNAVLRSNLLQSVLDVLEYNHNRKAVSLRFFEFGKTYEMADGKPQETEWLALYLTGEALPRNWRMGSRKADFFMMVQAWEQICSFAGLQGSWTEAQPDDTFAYGMDWRIGKETIATFGLVADSWTRNRDLRSALYHARINWNRLRNFYKSEITYRDIPKFPSVDRDISMLVPTEVTFEQISDTVRSVNPQLIKGIKLLEVYRGPNIEQGKKSYLLNVMLQDIEKTLTDEITDKVMEKVFEKLEQNCRVAIRKG